MPDPEAPFVSADKIVAVLTPDVLAGATAMAHLCVPDGWRLTFGSAFGLIHMSAPDSGGMWTIEADLTLGLWRADIGQTGSDRRAATLHGSPQAAADAIVNRFQALSVGLVVAS
jgi:hypothetical protein